MKINSKSTNKPFRILVVTSDLPSHPYACVKLSRVLASAGHHVTFAAPEGPAYERICAQVNTRKYSPAPLRQQITTITAGTVTTKKHMNVRPVVDSTSWTALLRALRKPFPLAEQINDLVDNQAGMYDPIKRMIGSGSFDLVVPVHSVAQTVCDAVEAAALGGHSVPPCVVFSSLPYDPLLSLGGERHHGHRAWAMPRSMVALPHVSTYTATPDPLSTISGGFIGLRRTLHAIVQLLWMALDAYLINRAWRLSERRNDLRRRGRGLPPVKDAYRGYLQRCRVISFGGSEPFGPPDEVIADNVTSVGCLDSERVPSEEIAAPLKDWVDEANDGIVYASFGTGTSLSEEEVAAIAHLGRSRSSGESMPRVLLALRTAEQRRLRPAMDAAVGAGPTAVGEGYVEYLDGALRVEADVPQVALLQNGRVRVFISHFGFGGFCEGVRAGVPFAAYPAGLDQWHNAQMAIGAGIALPVRHGMTDIESVVWRALKDESLKKRAGEASEEMQSFGAEERVLAMVEGMVKSRGQSRFKMTLTESKTGTRLLDSISADDLTTNSIHSRRASAAA